MSQSKVLVLGAGASIAYGYPSGRQLRAEILGISDRVAQSYGLLRRMNAQTGRSDFTDFRDAFEASMMYSIDAFLARRKEFAEIGKKCIAYALLKHENPKLLFREQSDTDNWYQYLFNHIASKDWEELSFNDLAIVTFNYDRSLQHFLIKALKSAYDKTTTEVEEKIKTLKIVHVYGSLSDKWPSDLDYFPYDGEVDYQTIDIASRNLQVIPESRIDSPTLNVARKWLSDADSICFLGFGFDPLNVERLAEGDACSLRKQRPQGRITRTVVGTCKGMTTAEISSAYATLTGASLVRGNGFFHDTGCTQALRETGFLAS